MQKEPRSRARKGYERNEVVRSFVFRKSVKTRRKKYVQLQERVEEKLLRADRKRDGKEKEGLGEN